MSIQTPETADALAHQVRDARTALFVPGDRPERFTKAMVARPGLVLLDLEDAVAEQAKEPARAAVLDALRGSQQSGLRAVVRVSPVGSPTHDDEVGALLASAAAAEGGLLGIMVPKAEEPAELVALARRSTGAGIGLVALIETAAGVLNAGPLAAVDGVTRLAFGAVDYCLDIDADPELEEVLDHPRTALVLASRAAGLPGPLDTPSTAIRDLETVERSARRGRAFGMSGKLCIHPGQIPVVEKAFAPSEQELRWARQVLSAEGGAAQVDGAMVDRPVLDRARRILAGAPSAPSSAEAMTAADWRKEDS